MQYASAWCPSALSICLIETYRGTRARAELFVTQLLLANGCCLLRQAQVCFALCREGAAETVDGANQNTEESNAPTAPAILWKPERIAADLKLSRQLIEKLDKEKGILSNPLIAADKLEEAPAGVLQLSIRIQPVSCRPGSHVFETTVC